MSAVGCAVGCTAFEEEPFAEVCDTVAESLVNGDMVEEWQGEEERGQGPLSFEDKTHTEAIAENSKVTPLFMPYPRQSCNLHSHPHFSYSAFVGKVLP